MAVDYEDFDPKTIADALRRNVEEYKPSTEREEVGRVIEAGDGIARVKVEVFASDQQVAER